MAEAAATEPAKPKKAPAKKKAAAKKKPAKRRTAAKPKKKPIEPPATLSESQRAAWNEALGILHMSNPGARVNLAQLEVYARAVVRMREAEAHVTEHGEIVPAPRTGMPIRNPYLAVSSEASGVVSKLSKALGLEQETPLTESEIKAMSLNKYGQRRGVSCETVRKAVKAGRLDKSVVMVKGKAKIADPVLADQEWEQNTRLKKAELEKFEGATTIPGGDSSQLSYNEARRRCEIEKWNQAKLKSEADALDLGIRRGELIPTAEARETVIAEYVSVKTKLLGIPTRIRQRLPHIAAEDIHIIDRLIREALEALSDVG